MGKITFEAANSWSKLHQSYYFFHLSNVKKMSNAFKNSREEEKLKEENDFLKMKLMLENGAEFGEIETNDEISPQMENEFLKYIIEFEKQSADHKYIKVFDKIGKPTHFKPVANITEEDIGKAWDDLLSWLNHYGIDLSVCSPNISTRELYRFTTEELFEHEMSDMNIPGMTTNYIYDEFYPDPVYESEKIIKDELFPAIFSVEPLHGYFQWLFQDKVKLNGKMYTNGNDVKAVFERFKSFFRQIKLEKFSIESCEIKSKNKVIVTGSYESLGISAGNDEKMVFEGTFSIELFPDDLGYWSVWNMIFEGINFE